MTTLINDEQQVTPDSYEANETQYESKCASEMEEDSQEEQYFWSEPGVCG
jgi:hypothetical protein